MQNVYIEENEVCELFKVTPKHLESLRKKGKGPKCIKIKRDEFLYSEDEVKKWFNK